MIRELESGKVYIVSRKNVDQYVNDIRAKEELQKMIRNSQTYFSKALMLTNYVVGVLVVAPRIVMRADELPAKVKRHQQQITVPFCLGKEQLVFFVEEEEQIFLEKMILTIEQNGVDTTEVFFSRFIESMLLHDMEQLQEIEVVCYEMEEHLTEKSEQIEPMSDIIRYRKRLLVRNFYYQQLADLCDILAGNDHDFFSDKTVICITEIGKRVDRLYQYSQMLREYMVQIRELYQQKIDIQQNKAMQVLTMVTTIFFPLTLVTGWYGMNFINMPELRNPYGYGILVLVCIAIIVLEIIYFKKKKYL